MNPHDPIIIAPPITEVPGYVWSRQYDKPAFLPGRPLQKPQAPAERFLIPMPKAHYRPPNAPAVASRADGSEGRQVRPMVSPSWSTKTAKSSSGMSWPDRKTVSILF